MRTLALLIGLFTLLIAIPGHADEERKREMAKRHFENGTEYYRTANYKAALEEFNKAYTVYPLPDMLFNIARSLEGLGRYEEAITRYEEYLRQVPEAKDRATLEERIANLRQRVNEQRDKRKTQPEARLHPQALPPAAPTLGSEAEVTAEERPSKGRLGTILGWSTMGVGAATLAISAILGGMALSKTGEYEDAHNNDHALYADAQSILSSAESYERGSFIALGVGLAAVATGTILLLLQPREKSVTTSQRSIRLHPYLSPAAGSGFVIHF